MFAAKVLNADTLMMFYLQYCTEYGMQWDQVSAFSGTLEQPLQCTTQPPWESRAPSSDAPRPWYGVTVFHVHAHFQVWTA